MSPDRWTTMRKEYWPTSLNWERFPGRMKRRHNELLGTRAVVAVVGNRKARRHRLGSRCLERRCESQISSVEVMRSPNLRVRRQGDNLRRQHDDSAAAPVLCGA